MRELAEILRLGAVESSDDGDRAICAPYIYCRYPDDQDAFATVAVTGSRVAVRSAPRLDAPLAGRVDYAILSLPANEGTVPDGWQAVI